jgi:hypothetical protein
VARLDATDAKTLGEPATVKMALALALARGVIGLTGPIAGITPDCGLTTTKLAGRRSPTLAERSRPPVTRRCRGDMLPGAPVADRLSVVGGCMVRRLSGRVDAGRGEPATPSGRPSRSEGGIVRAADDESAKLVKDGEFKLGDNPLRDGDGAWETPNDDMVYDRRKMGIGDDGSRAPVCGLEVDAATTALRIDADAARGDADATAAYTGP